jgi:hypothetical protein
MKPMKDKLIILDTPLARESVLCKIEPKPRLSRKLAEAVKV